MRYRVFLNYIVKQSAVIEVEADNDEEAMQKTDEIATMQCEEVNRNLEDSEVEKII